VKRSCIDLSSVGVLALLITVTLSAAKAADMPLKTPTLTAAPSWSGFYTGIEFGGGWSGHPDTWAPNDPASASLFSGGGGLPSEQPIVASYNENRKGPVGGLEAGYNWQVEQWVLGLEADFSLSGIGGSGGGTSFLIPSPPRYLRKAPTLNRTPIGTVQSGVVSAGWQPRTL
jgi:outer membrane immunogenic protein